MANTKESLHFKLIIRLESGKATLLNLPYRSEEALSEELKTFNPNNEEFTVDVESNFRLNITAEWNPHQINQLALENDLAFDSENFIKHMNILLGEEMVDTLEEALDSYDKIFFTGKEDLEEAGRVLVEYHELNKKENWYIFKRFFDYKAYANEFVAQQLLRKNLYGEYYLITEPI